MSAGGYQEGSSRKALLTSRLYDEAQASPAWLTAQLLTLLDDQPVVWERFYRWFVESNAR